MGDLFDAIGLTERDREFLRRVYDTPGTVYTDRIRAVGFTGMGRVLDAGCGFGQWSRALGELNGLVESCDLDLKRVQVCRKMMGSSAVDNVHAVVACMEALPYPDESFDGIFSYSSIYYADVEKVLSEFSRILRPGGKLYFNTNSIGWYLYNIWANHNPTKDFSPRRMALAGLWRFCCMRKTKESPMLPQSTFRRLEKAGFKVTAHGGDGRICVSGAPPRSFFPSSFLGFTCVYEVLCSKPLTPKK